MSAYRYAARTKVPVSRSRDEVEQVLEKIGASSLATMRDGVSAQVAFRLDGRNYLVKLPYPEGASEQDIRQRWRALLLVTKAKLEAIEAGITTVEAEFLSHAMLSTGQTLGEHLSEHPEQLTTSGRLMLPGGP